MSTIISTTETAVEGPVFEGIVRHGGSDKTEHEESLSSIMGEFGGKYLVHDGGDDNKGGGGGGGSSSCLIIRRPKELPMKNKMHGRSGATN